LLSVAAGSHYRADNLLEQGILAELRGRPQPVLFRQALQEFLRTSAHLQSVDQKMGELIAIHQRGKLNPTFNASLVRILREAPTFERVDLSGRRYSNVAGKTATNLKNPKTLLEIMESQRVGVRAVKKQLDETIQAFRAVIPLAERHEFAALILSGRHGFADKIQQSVDLMGVLTQYYVRSCMTTIDATMQAYPAGLEWLKDTQRKGAPRQP
jgi:hypothetical protein